MNSGVPARIVGARNTAAPNDSIRRRRVTIVICPGMDACMVALSMDGLYRKQRGATMRGRESSSASKLLQNVLSQVLVDFAMPWHWLSDACSRVAVPVVPAAMPHHHASGLLQATDQILPFHRSDNSATLRTSGISPLVRSRKRSFRLS